MTAPPAFKGKTGTLNEFVMPGPTRCVAVRYEYADGTGVPYVEFTVRKSSESAIIAWGTTDEYGNGLVTGLPPDAEHIVVEFDGDPEPYREFQPREEIPWPPREPNVEIPDGISLAGAAWTYVDWLAAPWVLMWNVTYGAIAGDIEKNPSIGQILGNVAIGFVPIAGQVADVRDVVANSYWLSEDSEDTGAWIGLTTTLISLVPGAGDVVKGIVKIVYKGTVNEVTRKMLLKLLNTFGQGSGVKYLGEVADKLVTPFGRDAVDLLRKNLKRTIELLKEMRNSKNFPESFGPELDGTIKRLETIYQQAENKILGIMTECQSKLKAILKRDKGIHVEGSGSTISDDVAASVRKGWQKEIDARVQKSREIDAGDPFESAKKAGVNPEWIKDAEQRLANRSARNEVTDDTLRDQIVVRQQHDVAGTEKELLTMGSIKGIAGHHLTKLKEFTEEFKYLIVVRETKSVAMRFFGWKSVVPKPPEVKLHAAEKGDYKGLVVRPDKFSADEWKNWLELEEKGYHFDKEGVLLNREGKAIHSDYDLQGVYVKNETGPGYKQVDTNNSSFLVDLNKYVCGGEPMFKHGANDDFLKVGKFGKQIPGRMNELDEEFAVIDIGEAYEIKSLEELKKFYNQKMILWIY
jgi:hypothetical protein